ncbi:MAG: hypothetical protein U5K69_10430 [Balneolaceae bacterium]|nr:hypothetical protein [Balneolaceae bacterium]
MDGISLTVAREAPPRFTVAIIPYTWEHTNLSAKNEGETVNLEFEHHRSVRQLAAWRTGTNKRVILPESAKAAATTTRGGGTPLKVVKARKFLKEALQLSAVHAQAKEKVLKITKRIHLKRQVPAMQIAGKRKTGGRKLLVNKIVAQLGVELPFWSKPELDIVGVDCS